MYILCFKQCVINSISIIVLYDDPSQLDVNRLIRCRLVTTLFIWFYCLNALDFTV